MGASAYQRASLAERTDFAGDLALFRIVPDEPLPFQPGQYATLALHDASGRLVPRAYSILSAPHDDGLTFVIERVEDGALTPLLWRLRTGDTLFVRRRVAGHFLLDATATEHVMLATVTGIAPFLSMVRDHAEALRTGQPRPPHRVLVLHGASHGSEFGPCAAQMQTLADEHEWLAYVPTISRPHTDPGWTGEVGRVEDVTRKYLDASGFDRTRAVVYACGHPGMISTVRAIAGRAGVISERFREEQYFPAPTADAPVVAPPAPVVPSGLLPGQVALRSVARPG